MNKLTIDDILNRMRARDEEARKTLSNTKEVWERIGRKDSFSELGLNGSELANFLEEWIKDNPYSNIQ